MKSSPKTVIGLEHFVVILLALGLTFRFMHWQGTALLIIAGELCFLFAAVIKIYKNFKVAEKTKREKWANFFTIGSGLLLGTAILFIQQHYPKANLLIVLGVFFLIVAIITTKWKLYLKKRHIVIAALYIFWTLTFFIELVKYNQFTDDVHIQIKQLRLASAEKLESISVSNKKSLIQTFVATTDSALQNVTRKQASSNLSKDYPEYIPQGDLMWSLYYIGNSLQNISDAFVSIFTEKEFEHFASDFNYSTDIQQDEDNKINSLFIAPNSEHAFFYYAWYLESLKMEVLNFYTNKEESSQLQQLVFRSNQLLKERVSDFLYRQKQLELSLIFALLFLIFSLYLDKVGVNIRYHKPLVFFSVFVFLEFIMLSIEPFLQLKIENMYLVSTIEVGLAGLIIPFHSMVEYNLYDNEG